MFLFEKNEVYQIVLKWFQKIFSITLILLLLGGSFGIYMSKLYIIYRVDEAITLKVFRYNGSIYQINYVGPEERKNNVNK